MCSSQRTPDDQMSSISDLLEVFFSYCAHISKKVPEAFANDSIDCYQVLAYGNYQEQYIFKNPRKFWWLLYFSEPPPPPIQPFALSTFRSIPPSSVPSPLSATL